MMQVYNPQDLYTLDDNVVNHHDDIIDVRYEIPGLEWEEPAPVQGCSIYAPEVETGYSSYGSEISTSKNRRDHKHFHTWFETIVRDVKYVYGLLKAGWPIPEEFSHIRTNIIEPLIGTWEEIRGGSKYICDIYWEIAEMYDIVEKNTDIAEAIDFIQDQKPLPLYLQHIPVPILRSAINMHSASIANHPDSNPIRSRWSASLDYTVHEVKELVKIISTYERGLEIAEKKKRERLVSQAFACLYRGKPLPENLHHIRADILQQIMQPDMLKEFDLGFINKNMNLLAPAVRNRVISAYKVMLAFDAQTDSIMDLLHMHYYYYMATGIMPHIELACDRNIFPYIVRAVAINPNPDKNFLISNRAFVAYLIRACSNTVPSTYIRLANKSI